jgi:hypothetical protein
MSVQAPPYGTILPGVDLAAVAIASGEEMKKFVVAAALWMWGSMAASAAELAPTHTEASLVTRPAGDIAAARQRGGVESVTRSNQEIIDKAALLGGFFFVTITTVLLASPLGVGNDAMTRTNDVRTTSVRHGKRTGREGFRNSPV